MTSISDAEPPDRGGSSEEDFRYESSFMDTDELNLIIKKVPFSGRKGHCSKSSQNAHVVQPVVSQKLSSSHPLPFEFKSNPGNKSGLTMNQVSSDIPMKYEINDSGPFIVILESIINNLGFMHPMSLGKVILSQNYYD